MVGALTFLYLNLFILPGIPILVSEDPQIYLMNATRMLEGQMIYRDFFQFTPPGTELLYLALFKLFGTQGWIPNAVLVLFGLGFAWLSIEISKKVVRGPMAFLPGLLFLTLAFRIWFTGSTHNWLSVLAVTAAVAVIIEKRTPVRLAGAGTLCGLASFFTQPRGILAVLGLTVFLAWEKARQRQQWNRFFKDEAYMLMSFFLAIVVPNAYFIEKVGLERFLDCTVRFVVRYFPSDAMYNSFNAYTVDLADFLFAPGSWMTYRLPAIGMWLFMHALVPFVYLGFFMRYRREAHTRPEQPWDRLMLLCFVGVFQLIGIASAPSWFRLCAISIPALVILVWWAASPGRFRKTLAGLLWGVALALVIAEPLERQIGWRACLDLPRGRTAFLEHDLYDKSQWLLQHTQPSGFFFRGVFPEFYFQLSQRNPAKVPYVTPTDFTRPEQVEEVVEALERTRARYVFWSVWLDVPGYSPPEGDHLGPLRAYLGSHYHVIKIFGDADYEQVWERNR